MLNYQGLGQYNSIQSETNHSVIRHNRDLNVPYVENDSYTNQNMIEPVAPDNHCGQGIGNNMMNMSYLSSNRSPEHASREFFTGESLRSVVQARAPTSQAANVQASNSLNIVPPSNGAANIHPQQFDSEFNHQPIMPVPNMRQLNEARHHPPNSSLFSFEAGGDYDMPSYDMPQSSHASEIGPFQSNHIDANPLAFVPPSNFSMGYASSFHGLFLGQTHFYPLYYHPYLFSQAQGSIGAIPYGQPFLHFPIFYHILIPFPWVSDMRPISHVPPFPPIYNVSPGGVNLDNIFRNIMFVPQTGAQSPYLATLNFDHGTANFLGNFAPPSHYGPFLNAPIGFPWFNAFDEYHMPTFFGVMNHPAVAPIGFPWPSSFNQLDLFNIAWFQNQVRMPQISEDLSFLGVAGPTFTDEARNHMLNEVQNIMRQLRNDVAMRTQELLILDYSLLFHLPDEDINSEEEDKLDEPVPGLSEEDIMAYLRLEEFQLPTDLPRQDVDCCCICQDDYAVGDDIGVLDCGHKFHYDCVKKWLGFKNTCPMCVRIGLAV